MTMTNGDACRVMITHAYFFVRGLITLIFFFLGRATAAAATAGGADPGTGERSRAARP